MCLLNENFLMKWILQIDVEDDNEWYSFSGNNWQWKWKFYLIRTKNTFFLYSSSWKIQKLIPHWHTTNVSLKSIAYLLVIAIGSLTEYTCAGIFRTAHKNHLDGCEVVEFSEFPTMLMFFFTLPLRLMPFAVRVVHEWKVVSTRGNEKTQKKKGFNWSGKNLFTFNLKQLRMLISDGTEKSFLNPNGFSFFFLFPKYMLLLTIRRFYFQHMAALSLSSVISYQTTQLLLLSTKLKWLN